METSIESAKGKKPGKSRIPDHLRRRALVSCDRCKKRRIRCIRPAGTDGPGDCQSCTENRVGCESTLPRKTRIYGSVETLSQRYRVLDALVKGLYPDADTNNIDTLYAIAEAHNISIPAFDDQIFTDEVFSHPLKHSALSPDYMLVERSPSTISKSPDPQASSSSKVIEEKLVPLPHGPSHYIGPSSSFGFVLTVRKMVAQVNSIMKGVQPDDERAKLSSDFAGSTWSKVLEPIAKAEHDESSDDQDISDPAGAVSRGMRKPSSFPMSAETPNTAKRLRKTPLLSMLPAREAADAFVAAYFQRVHPNYLLFRRENFQERYDAMWKFPGVLLRDVDSGWICCVFMMLVFGAQVLEDRDKAQSLKIQRHYLNLVQCRMHRLLSAATLVNVQAILLLQLYQHNCTERNSAFILLGCASRMAMALGMHREGTLGGFDEVEREVRKRVWWTAYIFEQNQCAILGRPCAIDDAEVNVSFPNEIMLDGGSPVLHGYVEQSVHLAKILSEVRRKIYSSSETNSDSKTNLAIKLRLDLDSWHQSLPPYLRLDYTSHSPNHRRAVTLLHIQFHYTQALVTRPFILRKVGVELARKLGKHVRSQDLDQDELNLSHACGFSAQKSLLLILQLLRNGTFDGVTWLDAFYTYHGVLILAFDFLARPWNDAETLEDFSRKAAVRDIMAALQPVKLCPTYTILTQVSLQLAKIVGIFDVTSPSNTQPGPLQLQYITHQPPPPYPMAQQVSQPQGGMEHAVTSWFQNKPDDVPWDLRDFFGVDGYVGPNDHSMFNMPQTLGSVYTAQLPSVSEEDDMGSPLPLDIVYTPWGATGAVFNQRTNG